MEEKSGLIELCGLWENENGNLVGTWGGARALVLPNKYKKESRHPTHRLFLGKKTPKPKDSAEVKVSTDDIPF